MTPPSPCGGCRPRTRSQPFGENAKTKAMSCALSRLTENLNVMTTFHCMSYKTWWERRAQHSEKRSSDPSGRKGYRATIAQRSGDPPLCPPQLAPPVELRAQKWTELSCIMTRRRVGSRPIVCADWRARWPAFRRSLCCGTVAAFAWPTLATTLASLRAWLGHENIQHTVRYTELAPDRFKNFWR